MTALLIFTNIFLYIALMTSLGIMMPQIIAMHKNKYADNSSIFTYAIYLLCNVIWSIYQIMFLVYTVELLHSKSQIPDPGLMILLWIQFVSDILSTALGVWLIILKYHYIRVGNIKKNDYVEKVLESREKNLLFLKQLEPFLNDELNFLYSLYGKNQKFPIVEESCELIKGITNIYRYHYKKNGKLPQDLKIREHVWNDFFKKLYEYNKPLFVKCISLTINDRIYLRKNKDTDLFTYFYSRSTIISKMVVSCRVMQAFKE